jgi:FMN reductase
VLIAAPVYRASFPGVLKNLLDIAPVEALQAKPVGIVAMGGSAHHYLAVDTQLRQVLGWFGALVAPTSVYLTGADFRDGQLAAEAARTDLVALVDTLLLLLRRLGPASLGPTPLAGKFT